MMTGQQESKHRDLGSGVKQLISISSKDQRPKYSYPVELRFEAVILNKYLDL